MSDLFQVKDARNRVLMETSEEEDARKWLEDHFPRHHVEPGVAVDTVTPDAILVHPGNSGQSAYFGGKWRDVEYKVVDGRFSPVED